MLVILSISGTHLRASARCIDFFFLVYQMEQSQKSARVGQSKILEVRQFSRRIISPNEILHRPSFRHVRTNNSPILMLGAGGGESEDLSSYNQFSSGPRIFFLIRPLQCAVFIRFEYYSCRLFCDIVRCRYMKVHAIVTRFYVFRMRRTLETFAPPMVQSAWM